MNAFIVDDEKPAREELRWLLDQCEGIRVFGEAADAGEARQALESPQTGNAVDVVFLDIDMPGVDGIRLAECLGELEDPPEAIFVTAYEEFAVDAFDVEAVDYLLKPVRMERLKEALERARSRLDQTAPAPTGPPDDAETERDSTLERISIEVDDHYRVVELDAIRFFESVEGNVYVQTGEGRYKTDFSLKFLEANLPDAEFFRCHRGTIVRLDAITHIRPAGAGTYQLHLESTRVRGSAGDEDEPRAGADGSNALELSVPLARSRAAELKRRIPWSSSVVD